MTTTTQTTTRIVARNRNNRTWTHFGIDREEGFVYDAGRTFTTKGQAITSARRAAVLFSEGSVEVQD